VGGLGDPAEPPGDGRDDGQPEAGADRPLADVPLPTDAKDVFYWRSDYF